LKTIENTFENYFPSSFAPLREKCFLAKAQRRKGRDKTSSGVDGSRNLLSIAGASTLSLRR
jgi:hypothetical protein